MKRLLIAVVLFALILFAGRRVLGSYALSRETGGDIEIEQQKDMEGAKRVALTFDDGPHPVYTERLLDGLKERKVKATFFLIGESIEGQEDTIRRMAKEGHLIGNHTYHHVELNKMNDQDACNEIIKTNEVIEHLTGSAPAFIRPPFGAWSKKKNCPVEMITVLWNVDPLDWKIQDTNAVVKRILKTVRDGSIILLHDIYQTSVEAALTVTDTLKKQGYEFVTVDELILD